MKKVASRHIISKDSGWSKNNRWSDDTTVIATTKENALKNIFDKSCAKPLVFDLLKHSSKMNNFTTLISRKFLISSNGDPHQLFKAGIQVRDIIGIRQIKKAA